LCNSDLPPARALIISARLLMLFEAGNSAASPLKTTVRLI